MENANKTLNVSEKKHVSMKEMLIFLIGTFLMTTITGVVNGFGTALGFTIAIVILAGIREQMEYNDITESFQGMPIVLVTSGLMAIAFFGFSGLI